MIFLSAPVCALFLLFLVPESPTHLVKKDKITGAEDAILKCYGPQYDAQAEVSRIQLGLKNTSVGRSEGWIKMFKRPEVWKPFCILIGLSIIQQFSGMSIMRAYAVKIFDEVFHASGNVTSRLSADCEQQIANEAYFAAILIGSMRLFSSLLLSKLLYHVKRRPMYFLSGKYYYIGEPRKTHHY